MERRTILVLAGVTTLAAVLALGLLSGPGQSDPPTDSSNSQTYNGSFSAFHEEPVSLSERRRMQIEAELSPPVSDVSRVRFSHLQPAETLYLVPVRRSPAGLKKAVVYFEENDTVRRLPPKDVGSVLPVRSHNGSLEFAMFVITNYYGGRLPHEVEIHPGRAAYERSIESCPNVSEPPTRAATTAHEDGRYVARVNFKDLEDGEMVHARITVPTENGYEANYTVLGPCGPVI